ncbi:hypothetical protein Hanom_Chr02g00161081 [Helianthus anomalus]
MFLEQKKKTQKSLVSQLLSVNLQTTKNLKSLKFQLSIKFQNQVTINQSSFIQLFIFQVPSFIQESSFICSFFLKSGHLKTMGRY